MGHRQAVDRSPWKRNLYAVDPEAVGAGAIAGGSHLLGPADGCGGYVPCIYHPLPSCHGYHRVQVKQRLPLSLGECLLPVF